MRIFWMLQVAALLLLPSGIYAYRHRRNRDRAVRGAGLVLAITFTLLFGAFIAGETLSDGRGWSSVGLTALWLLPMLGLSLLAWYRPQSAAFVLTSLLAIVAAIYLWSAFDSIGWRSFENAQGPVRGVISFALVAPISALGWSKPRLAGAMLLVLAALPMVVVLTGLLFSDRTQGWPLLLVSAPAGLIGLLYLASIRLQTAPSASEPTAPALST
jgi:asparagine N-glycosylation enzyme membrane subunit Stt3